MSLSVLQLIFNVMSRHRDFRNRQYSYDYDDNYYDDDYYDEEEDDEYYQEQERLRREREGAGQLTCFVYCVFVSID